MSPEGEFNYPRLERVIFGPGKIASLGGELERRGLSRAVVVTGKTLGSSALLEQVTGSLGSRLVGVFRGVRQHVPQGTTEELVAELRRAESDCMVSFGGGSPIDSAKVAMHKLLGDGRTLVHVAVPTTLSAGEYTPAAGVTDEATRVKHGVRDPRLAPSTVINDPVLTLETPDWLWSATGMRALDHAVESIYSANHQLLSDTLASKSIELLLENLAKSIQTRGAEQIGHRGNCQMAAWFSIFGSGNVRFGVSHALGHQIGPRWDVPHGVTSCITLPHVMRFMAEIAPERFGPIAAGFGVAFDAAEPRASALKCADKARAFIAGFDLPHNLSAAGVPREQMSQIVEPVHKEVERNKAVGRAVSREELAALLEAAYE